MSLASFLLKTTDNVDSELDALFKSRPQPPKRKLEEDKEEVAQVKRPKSTNTSKFAELPKVKQRPSKLKPKPKDPEEEAVDEDGSDVEAVYLLEKGGKSLKTSTSPEEQDDKGDSEDDQDGPSGLVHESLTGRSNAKSKHGSKQKYTPSDETPAQRTRRTIFIGNLPLEVAQKRPLQKQLQRHILSFISTAKVESIRFRSIPFNTPTARLASATTSDPKSTSHSQKNPSQRQHDRSRASSWQHTNIPEGEDVSIQNDEKQYLNPNQKKKIAFINQEFHTTADTVHAYVVFAHQVPPELRPKNLPPLDPVMDPYDAAKEAVRKANGSLFMERMIRVDFVGNKAGTEEGVGDGGEVGGVSTPFSDADPKSTLFVGNLDLASREEDLRVFFETLMKAERGKPPALPGGDGEGDEVAKMLETWVTKVRIIRDKDTQLGKGFGYVQFIERECVDEILSMESSRLKFAKRKLRVQRCKTIPGTKLPSSIKLSSKPTKLTEDANVKSKSKPKSEKHKPHRSQTYLPTPITIPKGNPTLGTKLANLSKEERKKAKASDADRVARRLAKKKARMVMVTPKDRALKEGGRPERKRERVKKNDTSAPGKKQDVKRKKGRVRSEKSLKKRNAKK